MEDKLCTLCEYSCTLGAPRCIKGELMLRVRQSEGADDDYIRDTLLAFIRFYGQVLYSKRRGNDSQQRIVRILSRNGTMTQNELQRALDIQPGSMSEIVSKLESKGLISKTRDETDKRKVVLTITPLGRDYNNTDKGVIDFQSRRMLDALTPEEEKTLLELYLKLLPAWGNPGPDSKD